MRSNSTHGVACNFDVLNTSFDMDRAGKALDEVKELKSYWNGTFYPLAEVDVSENGWCTWQLAKPAARQLAKQATRQLAAQTTRELSGEAEGIVYVFRRENSEESRKVICLREMESTGTYQLTFIREDYSREQMLVSGEELMKGLEIILNEKRSSLVIKYKRV